MFKKISMVTLALLFSLVLVLEGSASANKTALGYLSSGSLEDYIEYVDRSNGAITTVAPNSFDISPDGNLVVDRLTTEFVEAMHNRGVTVTPFISNHWNRELGKLALANSDKLTDDLVSYVKQYNLDGVNVDMENMTPDDRDAFTEFVKMLSEKMPEGKEVSVAVAANPKGSTVGWHGSYDYSEIAKYSDYLMIMSYDESYDGSEAGPVASLSFVEDSILFALNEGIPASKIVIGLPYYGRMWIQGDAEVANANGDGITLKKIDEFISKYGGSSTYVDTYDSVRSTFEITSEDGQVKLYNWTDPLPVGKYEVWHESPDSLKEKIELTHVYDLKGVGIWSLGQETTNVWENFDYWLTGGVYKDVDLNHWASESIGEMKEKGWMSGRTETLFAPEEALKRSETAAVLTRAWELELFGQYNSPFTDVSESYWAREPIEIARQNGIITGRKEDKFAPEAVVTREEMAVILSRIISGDNLSISNAQNFKDVSDTRWSADAIQIMSAAGIFGGFEDGTFRPENPVTRAQMATLLDRISYYVE
ncbi:S-layer homology domain-containing protein [Bacillus solimangrovi]|uniref:Glycoside hydrolase n=1 Tax=Bacillus solimangrovi TaxID=1305675 RepID=A0A1E5LE99_9BACI|nr:S-layer homology domain-containing protein [Bacillus solimangrovi]OEH92417.1 hypothetical protein BFG57_16035 [Bacillus solimangrovi]